MPVTVPTSDEFDALSRRVDDLSDEVVAVTSAVEQDRTDNAATIAALAARVTALEGGVTPPPPVKTLIYGASVEGGKPETFEAQVGDRLGVYRSYLQANDTITKMAARAQADVAAGRIPLMSTKLPYTWAQVAAGAADNWLRDRFLMLGGVPGQVWLCLHHEPRGDGAPADWVAMQQRARQVLDSTDTTNVTLVGILNGYSFTKNEADAYNHPVGSGVHIMGFDSYNPWFPGGNLPWKSAADTFAPGVTVVQRWGYPTLVGEYGVREDTTQPGKAAQWMFDAYQFALDNGFAAISYFNSGANSPDGPWTLTGERLAAFQANLAKPTTA